MVAATTAPPDPWRCTVASSGANKGQAFYYHKFTKFAIWNFPTDTVTQRENANHTAEKKRVAADRERKTAETAESKTAESKEDYGRGGAQASVPGGGPGQLRQQSRGADRVAGGGRRAGAQAQGAADGKDDGRGQADGGKAAKSGAADSKAAGGKEDKVAGTAASPHAASPSATATGATAAAASATGSPPSAADPSEQWLQTCKNFKCDERLPYTDLLTHEANCKHNDANDANDDSDDSDCTLPFLVSFRFPIL